MSLHVPPTETTEPVIVVPVALHALSASPEKLSPIFPSLSPVTVPDVAALDGRVTVGRKAIIVSATRSSDTNLLVILPFIFASSSFLFYTSCPLYSIRHKYLCRLLRIRLPTYATNGKECPFALGGKIQ